MIETFEVVAENTESALGEAFFAAPTDHSGTDATYRITVERIEEEPQWWFRKRDGSFTATAVHFPYIEFAAYGEWAARVFGTKANRAAKAQALYEATLVAGKE